MSDLFGEDNTEGRIARSQLEEELEFLRKGGLVEIVGINDDGDWLYSLSEKARSIIDSNPDRDPWIIMSELLEIVDEFREEE